VGLLTKQQILNARDIQTEDVPVPEWADAESGNDTVRVRTLTGRERDRYSTSLVSKDGKNSLDLNDMMARLVAACAIDADGTKLFDHPAEVEALSQKSAVALARVHAVAQRLNGMAENALEVLAKNSEAGQPGSSPSTSA